MNIKISNAKFHLGDVVKPTFSQDDAPAMVVVEVIAENVATVSCRYRYRCTWFRREKVWEFKDTWLYEECLLSVESSTIAQPNLEEGQSNLEKGQSNLEKGQSNLEKGQSNLEKGQSNLKKGQLVQLKSNEFHKTKHQSMFLTPSMSIIGFDTPKNKVELYDKNSNLMREASQHLAKCIYFNVIANKFSEIFLPLESLVNEDVLPKPTEYVST